MSAWVVVGIVAVSLAVGFAVGWGLLIWSIRNARFKE